MEDGDFTGVELEVSVAEIADDEDFAGVDPEAVEVADGDHAEVEPDDILLEPEAVANEVTVDAEVGETAEVQQNNIPDKVPDEFDQ